MASFKIHFHETGGYTVEGEAEDFKRVVITMALIHDRMELHKNRERVSYEVHLLPMAQLFVEAVRQGIPLVKKWSLL